MGTLNGIPVEIFIPDWDTRGKRVRMLRNIDMVNISDGLLAIWDGESKGTKHVIEYAKSRGLMVSVFSTKTKNFITN